MKAKPTLQEAIYIEGLPELYIQRTPADFWTREAFALFKAAQLAGLIAFDDLADSWTAGPGLPKGALAYFCKKASKRLHLNNGAHTNWKPFETMFNRGSLCWPESDSAEEAQPEQAAQPQLRPAAPLRLSLHNLQESEGQEALQGRIDKFFEDYSANPANWESPNPFPRPRPMPV